MLKLIVLSSAMTFALVSASAAQDRGSADDQAACEPEVHRLCDRFIPDETQIVACLKAQRAQLVPACRKVMDRS